MLVPLFNGDLFAVFTFGENRFLNIVQAAVNLLHDVGLVNVTSEKSHTRWDIAVSVTPACLRSRHLRHPSYHGDLNEGTSTVAPADDAGAEGVPGPGLRGHRRLGGRNCAATLYILRASELLEAGHGDDRVAIAL